jgi:Na+/H+ antiporter NhaD/arsenite permease-like protein
MSPFLLATAVFVLSYALIVSEKIHRTIVAMSGGLLLILLGVIDQEAAVDGVDFNTLGLLIGMMIIVNIARNSGMFQFVAIWTCRMARGRPVPIFIAMAMITATFSALLDNVTTVLLMTPVIVVVTNNLSVRALPWLIATILMSNIGGASTLIGDPPNIMIGSAANLSFNEFLVNMGPGAVAIGMVTILLLWLVYRGELVASEEAMAAVSRFEPYDAITDWGLLWRSIGVIGIVLVGFITHGITHLDGATIALAGAAVLLGISGEDPEHILRDVEWNTILFFAGLFVLVTGLEHVGAIEMLAKQLLAVTGGDPTTMALAVLWGSAICSAVVDNIPFVATMIPLVKDIAATTGMEANTLWWTLALGADIGGNATLVGASANVVVAGLAEKLGVPITFMEYLKVALPLTVAGIMVAHVYVWAVLL